MDFLDITKPEVHEFLWAHIVPKDFGHDCSKADAFKDVYEKVIASKQWLVGDMEAGLVFRCVPISPWVLQPHIMGDPARLRTLLPLALDIAWSKGITKVEVWTQHASIARILTRMGGGWAHEATLPARHWDGEAMRDIHIMGLQKCNQH